MELLTIIILLAIVTLLLFAIEALITPGFGVAGICGAVCAVVANILTFIRYGNAIGMLSWAPRWPSSSVSSTG